ncbi:tRNA (N(6)-L-threonylcarbamoyladenosine(37)-C(2))-methylthiotransferase [Methanolacinia paynteri]|uniref:tRNA (N(6)-L-threonylcarbamoyladenosine(37)-C(2))- methylthiotransferase n=1 Tax=Methanolacinia paynteri TaxID=230356 RepID=UPI00064F1A9A|nr:tRNA (N(6)-L-threonylcarbamoyladenosine(37)-C(2))-methylthiotransferase [Methanolacinia paynteri]
MHTLKDKKIHIETYGCTFNFADTEKIVRIAEKQGCSIVPPGEAEAVIINTCTVVAQTERAMLRAIAEFPDKEIYVTGCMAVVQPDLIYGVRPDARLILPEDLNRCPETIGALVDGSTGIVQTARGCVSRCAYCITRSARGHLRSFPEDKIIEEIERLVSAGAVEIQLTGQDLSAYGMDTGSSLPELLDRINSLEGEFMVRVGMMNPSTAIPLTDELSDAFLGEKIFSFAHLPVQSGSDKVLSDMNREYRVQDFRNLVAELRKKDPVIRISTDFIVGYPTETEDDFLKTLAFFEEIRPTKVNITRFSAREGTDAAKLKDIPDWIKKERSRTLTIAANRLYDSVNESFIGKDLDVIVTERKRAGSCIARDKSYNNIVIEEELDAGARYMVRIVSHRRHYLIGERIE